MGYGLITVLTTEPFPKQQILHSSKLKEFTDDNFKFDENGGKFSKRVENTVGKGEIARYEQFLLLPQCFKSLKLQTLKNQGLFGKELNSRFNNLSRTESLSPLINSFIRHKSGMNVATDKKIVPLEIINLHSVSKGIVKLTKQKHILHMFFHFLW